MADNIKGRVRSIIMDKAANADNLTMQGELGYQSGGYAPLTQELNVAFHLNLTDAEVETQATVLDVINLVESKIPH
jgi:hypothetical protein